MRIAIAVAALAVIVLTGGHEQAEACSPSRTFVPPTNVELVAQAPRIVVTKVVADDAANHQIEFEVTRVLRDTTVKVGARFKLEGFTGRYLGGSPDKFDFRNARRGAYTGACIAMDYAVGKHYVMLLVDGDLLGVPFSRVNEEIDPAADPWLDAVIEYVKVADAPGKTRDQLLDKLVARGKLTNASKTDVAIAADVERHRETPTPSKTFAELETMYQSATDARQRSRIVVAIGTSGDPNAKRFLLDLLAAIAAGTANVDDGTAYNAIGAYFEKIPDRAAVTAVVKHYIAAKAKKHDRWPLMNMLIRRADATHSKLMIDALGTADEEEAGRLAEWFARFPSPKALANLRARIKDFDSARFELVIGVARLGDPAVIAWSEKKLTQPPDDNRWMALYSIAGSPLPQADRAAGRVIALNSTDLVSLIQGYKDAHHPRVSVRLAEIGKLQLSSEAAKWLKRTIDERAAKP